MKYRHLFSKIWLNVLFDNDIVYIFDIIFFQERSMLLRKICSFHISQTNSN